MGRKDHDSERVAVPRREAVERQRAFGRKRGASILLAVVAEKMLQMDRYTGGILSAFC